ncbi:MAG: hypothetical protein JWN44_6465 [Myxococcales bacterium]|nr:hypothetical protein [Myxococcales bacterium]
MAATAQAAPVCKLRAQPWLEGRLAGATRAAHAVDARRGQSIELFVAANGTLDGRRVVFSDDRKRGHTPWTACDAHVAWRRVEPRMQHVATKAPNASVPVYANAVVLGPDHGKWIGFDRLEYFETALPGDGTTRVVRDAAATVAGPPRPEGYDGLGVMRLAATVRVGGDEWQTAGADDAPEGLISPKVFRYSFRRGDDFLGWLTAYFNVPYLFGSAGKGTRNQAERYLGADCADVLVAALRHVGSRLEYTSVAELVDTLPHAEGAVRPGDLYALDYVGFTDLPRSWDHIVALVEDRGPDGKPDGKPGPEDLVADSGNADGLKVAPLAEQGEVRIAVLRAR